MFEFKFAKMVAIFGYVMLIQLQKRSLSEFGAVEVEVSLKKLAFIYAELVHEMAVLHIIFADLPAICFDVLEIW